MLNGLCLTMATGNEELEQFKTQINLCDYAETCGFKLDRKQSSKSSVVMRHSCGDKIVVARMPSGHWIYFNVHGSDSGSILDFVASRKSLTLGHIRRELRPWARGGGSGDFRHSKKMVSNQDHDLVPTKQDFNQINRTWASSGSVHESNLYLRSRGISEMIINDPIFNDRMRIDERNNCIFPHWNGSGILCGFEIKNKGFTGFSPGGEKGLWCSRPRSTDNVMVVCESTVDALSVATIFQTKNKRFFSTAGTCSPSQVASLVSAAGQMPRGSQIWLAFDNDAGGQTMAKNLHAEFHDIRNGLEVFAKLPEQQGQDWNDVLQEQQTASGENRLKFDRSVEPSR